MGSGSSKELHVNTDLMYQAVRGIRFSLSERDRKLFEYAVENIVNEEKNMENIEVFIVFQDQDPITVRAKDVKKVSGRIFVRFVNEMPKCTWEYESFGRKARHFVTHCMKELIKFVIEKGIPIGIGAALGLLFGPVGGAIGGGIGGALGYALGDKLGSLINIDSLLAIDNKK